MRVSAMLVSFRSEGLEMVARSHENVGEGSPRNSKTAGKTSPRTSGMDVIEDPNGYHIKIAEPTDEQMDVIM